VFPAVEKAQISDDWSWFLERNILVVEKGQCFRLQELAQNRTHHSYSFILSLNPISNIPIQEGDRHRISSDSS